MLGAQFFWFMFILFLVRGSPCSGTCMKQHSTCMKQHSTSQCMHIPLPCSASPGCSLGFAQRMTCLGPAQC